MAEIKLKGNPIQTSGNLPAIGTKAPDFLLTKVNLSDVSLKDYEGKKLILNIFPSVDTAVCATSVRKFNEKASSLDNVAVLCISTDMPFAHSRFCGAEGIKNVDSLSELRNRNFGNDYGLRISTGPLAGVLSRCIIVLDEKGIVKYTEQVPEITQEPDYEKALQAI
ncbi:MAG: thiol peroxidase [Leptospiraceae bacterium]|nr:thiol peroxidase [Leptospiraceae bacterium]